MPGSNIINCDVCQAKEAEVFLTQIVGGKMQKVNLCKSCSKDRGVDDPTGFALTELLAGLGTSTETESPAVAHGSEKSGGSSEMTTVVTATKCPVCGFTQADFKKTGRLGCSECYLTFAESLGSLLKAMHKGTHHTGKMPVALARRKEITDRMQNLQSDLQKAVLEEDYENAASLRDQIKRLTGRVGS